MTSSYCEWLDPVPDEELQYYEKIENYFGSRGGFPWIIRGRDWMIARSWFDRKIPFEVIRRSIDEFFHQYGFDDPPRFLGFVDPFVKQNWKSFQISAIGRFALDTQNRITMDQVHGWFANWRGRLDRSADIARSNGFDNAAAVFEKYQRSLSRLEKILDLFDQPTPSLYETLHAKLDGLATRFRRDLRRALPHDFILELETQTREDLLQRLSNIDRNRSLSRLVRDLVKRKIWAYFRLPDFSVLSLLRHVAPEHVNDSIR